MDEVSSLVQQLLAIIIAVHECSFAAPFGCTRCRDSDRSMFISRDGRNWMLLGPPLNEFFNLRLHHRLSDGSCWSLALLLNGELFQVQRECTPQPSFAKAGAWRVPGSP